MHLLRYALFNFPTVKRVVYSTCSVYPEENEEVIDEILRDIGDAYKLLPMREIFKDNWINYSSEKYNCGNKCLYTKPETDFCNGFFVAIFERNFNITLPEYKHKKNDTECLQVSIHLNNISEKILHEHEKYGKEKSKVKTVSAYTQTMSLAKNTATITISNCNNKEITLHKFENMKSKGASKKKKSKYKHIIQIEQDSKIIKTSNLLKKRQHKRIVTNSDISDNTNTSKKRKKEDMKVTDIYNIPNKKQHKQTTSDNNLLMDNISIKKKGKEIKNY